MQLMRLAFKNARILADLTKADFKNRYLNHYLGMVWALLQPLVMVGVYWFVFTKGFGIVAISGASFLLWLFAGMVPWILLNDAITNASYSIFSQAYLVKKIVFEVRLLPLVKIGSAMLVNASFWFLLLMICLYDHHYPTLLWLQLIYYFICISSLCLVFSLFFSAIIPFAADTGQALNILFQILFWVTPVTWNYHLLPESWMFIIKLNPFAYVINGVRETLINQIPFWHHPNLTMYFWLFTMVMYGLSYHTFNRLRPHFADVL